MQIVAPQRPPLWMNCFTPGAGIVAMLTRWRSSRASSIHTSFGQSAPSSMIDSSVTTRSPRSKSGSTYG